MSHATSAPATPVSLAKRLGRLNTPAPTMDPTTMAARVRREIFPTVPCSEEAVRSFELIPPQPPRLVAGPVVGLPDVGAGGASPTAPGSTCSIRKPVMPYRTLSSGLAMQK